MAKSHTAGGERPGTPTIKDVARRAGVSIATVSRVINDREEVSDHARDSVHRAMADIGFRPNSIGRMLKTARSGTLGVLIPTLKNPIFADVVHGVQLSAEQHGYNTLLVSSDYDPQRELAAVETLLANRVEGLVLTVADEANSSALRLLRGERVPFVLVFNPATVADCSTVTVDNERAAAAVVRELIARGHRHIGLIVGRIESSDRSLRRRAGYRMAMKEAGLSPSPVFEVAFDQTDLTATCKKVLTHKRKLSAVFCSTDMLAIGAIRGFIEQGARVPEDVAVVGFDGIATGEWITPSLATVVQPAEEMGRKAVQHLVEDRIKGDGQPLHLTLEYRIRPGESWGRPAYRRNQALIEEETK